MRKNRPQVTSELKDWHDWLVNHFPKTIKVKASSAFETFKDKVMGLFKGGNERETKTQPYQLKGKIEPPEKQPSNQKQIKRMKKKLVKLNKKIRHSKRKPNNLISKRNSIKRRSKSWKDHVNPKNPLIP